MSDLRDRGRAWLTQLDARAPTARDHADAGRPAPLEGLLDTTQRDADAEILSDFGAWTDLQTEDPDLAGSLDRWRTAQLTAEAQWRARLAQSTPTVGEQALGLVEVESLLADRDPEARSASLRSWSKTWRAAIAAASSWRPTASPAAPPPAESSGSLIIAPSAELVAAVSAGGLVDPRLLPQTPDRPALPVETADLEALVRELAAATAISRADFGTWRFAARGRASDFTRDEPLPAGPPLRAGRPLVRGDRGVSGPGHEGLSLVLGDLTDPTPLGPARALAWLAPENLRRGLRTAPAEPREAARELGLVIGILVLEAAWVSEESSTDDWQKSFGRTWGGNAPNAWAEMAMLEADLEGLPGESSAVYPRGRRVVDRVLAGAARAAALRERHDVDWPHDPDLVPDPEALGAEPSGLGDLVAWIADAARL